MSIRTFFEKSDEFLKVQFAHAHGSADTSSVQNSLAELIKFLRLTDFEDSAFVRAKEKWIAILDNSKVHLGFDRL